MKTLIYALALLLSTTACIREIDISYPESDTQLTLNAVLMDGKAVQATLSSTLPYTHTGLSPFYKDGLVRLYENGKLIDTLLPTDYRYRAQNQDTIWYYQTGYAVKAGNSYRMSASRPGFGEVSASTYIPAKAAVENIVHTTPSFLYNYLEITLQDPESAPNFFMIELAYVDEDWDSTMATLRTEDPTVALYSYYGIWQMPLEPKRGDMAFFTDEYFRDGKKTISLTADLNTVSGVVNKITIYSASEEYYEYLKSFAINSAFGENPFAEPIRVKSNVENGFGVVGGLSRTVIRL